MYIFKTLDGKVFIIGKAAFAAKSEHITLRTAPNGKVFYRDDASSLVEFAGV